MTLADPQDAAAPDLPGIEAGALAAALAGLGPGERLVLVEAERHAVVAALRGSTSRSALALPAADARDVEVVMWTPGARAGNPLFPSLLPDFSAVRDDPDERDAAVEMAAEVLAPLAGARSNIARGVLNDALRAFPARGGGGLGRFTASPDPGAYPGSPWGRTSAHQRRHAQDCTLSDHGKPSTLFIGA